MDNGLPPGVTMRVALHSDMQEFYGDRPYPTACARLVCLDGVPAAMVGVMLGHGPRTVFCEIKASAPKKTVWRAAKAVMAHIAAMGYSTLYAIADHKIAGAPAFLKRLGWQHIESSTRGELFIWQTR